MLYRKAPLFQLNTITISTSLLYVACVYLFTFTNHNKIAYLKIYIATFLRKKTSAKERHLNMMTRSYNKNRARGTSHVCFERHYICHWGSSLLVDENSTLRFHHYTVFKTHKPQKVPPLETLKILLCCCTSDILFLFLNCLFLCLINVN